MLFHHLVEQVAEVAALLADALLEFRKTGFQRPNAGATGFFWLLIYEVCQRTRPAFADASLALSHRMDGPQ